MAASRGLCLGQALLRRAVLQRPQAAQVLLGIRRGKCLCYTFFKIVTLEQLQRSLNIFSQYYHHLHWVLLVHFII